MKADKNQKMGLEELLSAIYEFADGEIEINISKVTKTCMRIDLYTQEISFLGLKKLKELLEKYSNFDLYGIRIKPNDERTLRIVAFFVLKGHGITPCLGGRRVVKMVARSIQ